MHRLQKTFARFRSPRPKSPQDGESPSDGSHLPDILIALEAAFNSPDVQAIPGARDRISNITGRLEAIQSPAMLEDLDADALET